jgi:hypothetical protein
VDFIIAGRFFLPTATSKDREKKRDQQLQHDPWRKEREREKGRPFTNKQSASCEREGRKGPSKPDKALIEKKRGVKKIKEKGEWGLFILSRLRNCSSISFQMRWRILSLALSLTL